MRKPLIIQDLKTGKLVVLGTTNRLHRWDIEVVATKGSVNNTLTFTPSEPVRAVELATLVHDAVYNDPDMRDADKLIMYVYLPSKK